jgi:parvulin-like peptidyl-prolyl isomerase
MKTPKMLTLLTLAMAFFGPGSPLQAEDAVVAKIGDREVTAAEIRPFLDGLPAADRTALTADKAALTRFVRSILVNRAVLQDATEAGWDKKPQTVAGLARLRDQYLVESYLAEVGQVPDDYPSEEEVQKVYAAEKERLKLPKRYRVAQIFIAADDDKEAAGKRAQEIADTLKDEPGEFASLAKRNSDDAASAARGGELGWLAEAEITPEIRTAVAGLSKGQISAPVEGRSGFHILMVEDIRAAGPASLEEVKDQLAAALRNQRAALNREAHVASLLQKNPVSVNELAFDSLK